MPGVPKRALTPSLEVGYEEWGDPRGRPVVAVHDATAGSFDTPDFVDVVAHYYRHRWGNAPGDPRYDGLHARLQEMPAIAVPTILLCGAAGGRHGRGRGSHSVGLDGRPGIRIGAGMLGQARRRALAGYSAPPGERT